MSSTQYLPIFNFSCNIKSWNQCWLKRVYNLFHQINRHFIGKKCSSESVSSAEKFRESVMSKGITFFCSFGQRNSFFLFFNFQVRIFLVKDTHLSLRRSPPFFKKWQIGFWFAWQEWRISWKHFQRVKQHLRDVWKFIRNCDIFCGCAFDLEVGKLQTSFDKRPSPFFPFVKKSCILWIVWSIIHFGEI